MSTNETEVKSSIVGPLNFSTESSSSSTLPSSVVSSARILNRCVDVQCLLCDVIYKFYDQKDEYLAHLYLEHRLVIGDEDQVAIFDEYLIHWRDIFNGDASKLAEYCTTMMMDQLPDGTPSKNEKYYLLCDVLPKDNELRRNLQVKRLEAVLAQHQFERIDTSYERVCLYCRDVIGPTRNDFLEHLFAKHFLQLGKSENLVFIDELIDIVQAKMNALICLFCEKTFKDRPTLKEHMRKKGHKRINPENHSYDKFFLVNYRNEKPYQRGRNHKIKHRTRTKSEHSNEKEVAQSSARSTMQRRSETQHSSVFETNNSDSDWSDWEGDKQVLTCLFCSNNDTDFVKLKRHMIDEHDVDFDARTATLSFYDRVKIVNFIRRQMHLRQCIKCDDQFKSNDELREHLRTEKHCDVGERSQWDLPEYFFPTYEDDAFLCSLDVTHDSDTDISSPDDTSVIIHSEDQKISINADAEALSKERLLEFWTQNHVKSNKN